MVLPILSYGHRKLIQPARAIDQKEPGLQELIDSMWETLNAANGSGLAAPQIDKSLQLFIVDSETTFRLISELQRNEYYSGDEGIKETFINARILSTSEEMWTDREGCLSMPSFTVEVKRPWSIEIEYFDRNFQLKRRTFKGLTARMIQHEYDHTQGVLFLDYLSSFTKIRLKEKLNSIRNGDVHPYYSMKFPKKVRAVL